MFGQILAKVIGTQNDREVKRLRPRVEQVNSFEPRIGALSDTELKAKTAEFRERLGRGEALNDLLPKPSPWSARRAGACSTCGTTTCSSSAGS